MAVAPGGGSAAVAASGPSAGWWVEGVVGTDRSAYPSGVTSDQAVVSPKYKHSINNPFH